MPAGTEVPEPKPEPPPAAAPPEREPSKSPVEWVAYNAAWSAYTSQVSSKAGRIALAPFYPVWVGIVVLAGLCGACVYYPLWLLLAPVRARQKRVDPEGYEASQRK